MTTALPPSQVGSGFGARVRFRNLRPGGGALPQRVAIIAQGSTASIGFPTTKLQIFDAQTAGETYGFGSPIHTMAKQMFPPSGDGVGSIPVTVYPLADGTTASAGDITPVGTSTEAGTITINISNVVVDVALASGTNVAAAVAACVSAINAELDMPVTAVDNLSTSCDLTVKWKGLTGDDITVSVTNAPAGLTFGVTQPTGGAGNPAIDSTVTDQFGDVWETMVVHSLGNDTTALTALAAFNEGRWDPTVSKFFIAFYASAETNVSTAITVPDARKTDRTNCQLDAPGCNDQLHAIAARKVSFIVRQAEFGPATDYTGIPVSLLTPGADSDQWDNAERETAVKGGASTTRSQDGVIKLWDTFTMYHPTGDPTPAYRKVVTIVKLMQLVNDVQQTFNGPNWLGKPLIPNGQATSNPDARKPEAASAEIARLMASWADDALISDLVTALSTIQADIDGSNPDRLNIDFTVQLSGNANLISLDLNFGFFFGG